MQNKTVTRKPLRVRLNCGCVVEVIGGWIDVVEVTRLSVQCPNGHKWQNVKEEITEGNLKT